jgi:hypothetical protein
VKKRIERISQLRCAPSKQSRASEQTRVLGDTSTCLAPLRGLVEQEGL